jgi:hypothetical protein
MKDEYFKWAYTFFLAVVTLCWGIFCIESVKWAVETKAAIDIIAASGVNVVLGILLAMWKDVNQFWFRKAKDTASKSSITTGVS